MTGVVTFFVGVFAGGVCAWCWTMCWAMRREAEESAAVDKQFDDGLSQDMRAQWVAAESIRRASNRAVRRLRQAEAIDAARAREGFGPSPCYDPPPDDPLGIG